MKYFHMVVRVFIYFASSESRERPSVGFLRHVKHFEQLSLCQRTATPPTCPPPTTYAVRRVVPVQRIGGVGVCGTPATVDYNTAPEPFLVHSKRFIRFQMLLLCFYSFQAEIMI